ncbi:DUF447 domain-containing protein [Roseiconus lacunae]|uniref:DUF447 domain-containing protein n=1 Tax=Roseiconus lacunae TaxID=2605694 RepID=UPI003084A1CD|nr:DUF447 domain-containing protein [Stieleria sp. HD01]
MILETIVTTVDLHGRVNLAPMGPWVEFPQRLRRERADDPGFLLRPYDGSQTIKNLLQTRRATIHLTDDARLIAQAAIGPIDDADQRVTLREIADADPDDAYSAVNKATHAAEPAPDRVITSAQSHAILNECHRWFAIHVDQIRATPPRNEMRCRVIDQGIERPFIGFNRAKHAVIEAAILATRVGLIDDDVIRVQLDGLRSPVEKTASDDERVAFEMIECYVERKLSARTGDSLR